MANEWHYSKSGERFGPVSGQQLKELVARGEIGPADLVWKEGMKEWVPAKAIKGLFDVPPNSATAPVKASEPPPLKPDTGSTPTTPASLLPVLIVQTVIASFGVLFGFMGINEIGFYGLGSLEGIFICISIGWNIAILVTAWLGFKQQSYWFSLLAARMMFASWFFFLFADDVYTDGFSVMPSGFVILGILLSIPVGIWAISTLRKPDVTAFFGKEFVEESFSHTLLGTLLGSKWENLDQKKKPMVAGGCVVSLILLVVIVSWLMRPGQSQWAGGGPGRSKTLQEATDERNTNLGDVTAKRNQNLEDVRGKRNQTLEEIIAKRNANLGKPSTPAGSGSESGGSDDQANRDRIETNLQGMSLNSLMAKYGRPDSIWMHPTKNNIRLYAWKLGGSSTDMNIVQLVIHSIDGRSPNIEENAKVLTSSQFDQLKQRLATN